MTTADPDAIKREIEPFLPLRELQITAFTDSMLLRNTETGACGQASCLFIEWKGTAYAVSCHHTLAELQEYIVGAKRLKGKAIKEDDTHEVAPLRLLGSDETLDLALFDLNGLTLLNIPKRAYSLSESRIDLKTTTKHLGGGAFIHGVPGFGTRGTQYDDGLVFLKCPIYSAYGPIVEVYEDLIVADFAEMELSELNDKDFPYLKDLEPTGGTRNLSGMSGSGLWVICNGGFVLLGILLGPTEDNRAKIEHRIRFTPVWKLIKWLEQLELSEQEFVT